MSVTEIISLCNKLFLYPDIMLINCPIKKFNNYFYSIFKYLIKPLRHPSFQE